MQANIKHTVALSKDEILDDITKGLVPATITSFEELHDYVDANEYGNMDEIYSMLDHDDFIDYMNLVQIELDSWISSGMKAGA